MEFLSLGCCWIRPDLLEELEYNQNYWLAVQADRPLNSMRDVPLRPAEGLGAPRYDVFCPANFLNFVPWTAAVGYLVDQGMDRIAEHDQRLVTALVEGLLEAGFQLSSPADGPGRSTLVVASHRDPTRNPALHRRLEERGIDIALREGRLRFSPHLYNTDDDIAAALETIGTA